jgi:hypothetical protein
MKKEDIIPKINSLDKIFVKKVTDAITAKVKETGNLDHYEIVWRQIQIIAATEIKSILEKEFPGCKITIPTSKSTYPDIKLEHLGGTFAIDIKVNEMQKNPWFDMARLDTIIVERINKYDEEWELVIKYDSETKKFLKAYFNLFRDVVGIRSECNGVKYRPYDGKLRPKDWTDFESNKTYWPTKEKFLEGIKNSQKHRWKVLIKDTLIPILNKEDKKDFSNLFS